MSRKEPTLRDKLAAALRELLEIPYEHARQMSAGQIISLVQFHHVHYHADKKDEPDVDAHWNLDPLLIGGHKARTAKIDIPQIAKTKRLSKEHEDFQRRLLTPRDDRPKKKRSIPSRPFPSRKAKP